MGYRSKMRTGSFINNLQTLYLQHQQARVKELREHTAAQGAGREQRGRGTGNGTQGCQVNPIITLILANANTKWLPT